MLVKESDFCFMSPWLQQPAVVQIQPGRTYDIILREILIPHFKEQPWLFNPLFPKTEDNLLVPGHFLILVPFNPFDLVLLLRIIGLQPSHDKQFHGSN